VANPTDVVIVVLDCVRFPDFPFGAGEPLDLPVTRQLLEESVLFPKAAAVAPWTLPSHASILSGRYFWRPRPVPTQGETPRTLPSEIREAGYASFALLSNPILGNDPATTREFGTVRTGQWWEPYLRIAADHVRSSRSNVGRHWSALPPAHTLRQLTELFLQASLRYPTLPRELARTLGRIRNGGAPPDGVVAPWIEAEFEREALSARSDRPFFGFVNLMDAHEPYLDPRSPGGAVRSALRSRQDRLGWLMGKWRPTSSQLTELRDAYHGRLELLDRRLGRLFATLRAGGRWRRSLVVVTSDHGQCFGEHGMMFHSQRVDEQLLRIPLIVKFPNGEHNGETATGWASLVDIAPTVLAALGKPIPESWDGQSLTTLIRSERARPIFALSTGVDPRHARKLTPELRKHLDGTRFASYFRQWKLVTAPRSGEDHLYEIERDPGELDDLRSREGIPSDFAEAIATSEVSSDILDPARGRPNSVTAHLASWGY
jgi:arylsulfatase A-like enzyme